LVGRALSVGIVALLVLGGVATTAGAGTAAQKSPLGTKDPAAKVPVKVGLITTGGDCSGCGGEDEPAAAEAAVGWLNDYHQGLAGHEMDLVTCIDSNDPGKGTDCANQMIREGVAAVVIGSNGILEQEWRILHDAGIPVINHSATNASLLEDTESTFILYDPNAQTVNLPLSVAKRAKAKKISVIVVDVPTATEIYDDSATKRKFKKAGIDLDIIPVPLGAPDMTPQAQQIVANNPDGVVSIVGHDAFCIPALNGLQAVGFEGTISTISFCVTDAMRKGAPKELVEGMKFGAEAPFGDKKDPSIRQYSAALKKYTDEDVDPDDQPALTVFQSFGALSLGTKTLTGEVTPDSVIAAMRAMDNEVLPASGGRLFRCNGKASTVGPSVCSAGTVTATLNADGEPKGYTLDNNQPIGD
jgi:ABC-type branched-subunit amino acid transport system substrate-binding protein